MKESSSDSPYIDRIRSWARSKAHGGFPQQRGPDTVLPVTESPISSSQSARSTGTGSHADSQNTIPGTSAAPNRRTGSLEGSPTPTSITQASGSGTVIDPTASDQEKPPSEHDSQSTPPAKKSVFAQTFTIGKMVLFHSWINVLLVFVPVGLISHFVHAPAEVVFAMNAIAIIPLAGLLSYATETVAAKMGDAIGALLNVTFGNAVELIIFIIALVKNEIRIVQSSLLGSILANLLLILGMSFFLGGLRFQEQVYNATVTQMSACLLSLSVMSLVLPTAFHASFSDTELADRQSLKISRGTSVILLLVYAIYLLFQLKSHAYLYESTPQHIIENEYANPGPAQRFFDSSSSDDSSSSSSDSDDSERSRNTVSKRVKRVIRAGRRRKSSVASADSHAERAPTRTPSFGTNSSPTEEHVPEELGRPKPFHRMNSIEGSEEAIEDDHNHRRRRKHKHCKKNRKSHKKHSDNTESGPSNGNATDLYEMTEEAGKTKLANGETRRIDFALSGQPSLADGEVSATCDQNTPSRRSLANLRNITGAKVLVPTVFKAPPLTQQMPQVPPGPVPRVRYGIRRTNSLPDRLNQHYRPPGSMPQAAAPLGEIGRENEKEREQEGDHQHMSRGAAVILLLVSTGLVALCAEFLVDSINDVVKRSPIGEVFIGLIILPIVGNAAEHVTAVAVAMKNKMDLSIGVAIGSSIQIALFITPLIVILGWILDREMTLYFSLFETVCLFVSAFIANFLVLDGRSNYLEGALLCSTYIIISVVAFFYPNGDDRSDGTSIATTVNAML